MIHTNRCKHCGKRESDHTYSAYAYTLLAGEFPCHPSKFEDSGLAALDAHKEELYLAIVGYFDGTVEQIRVESILNQIEKEK